MIEYNMDKEINGELGISNESSPWGVKGNSDILFPLGSYEELITYLGWDISEWVEYCIQLSKKDLCKAVLRQGIKSDWFWGLAFPYISLLKKTLDEYSVPMIFGISGLPGCGKSFLGKWLNQACMDMNLSVKVISLDDFYFPAIEMQEAMRNNPWKVPRGIPGSHSIDLLTATINKFLETGELVAPKFDKSLREGRGDRCGWINSSHKILIIEGWFLGCYPQNDMNYLQDSENTITQAELHFRYKINANLKAYTPVWKSISNLWHMKSGDFNYTNLWKVSQERQMQKLRGSSLRGEQLSNFIRMIHTAIPVESLMNIKSKFKTIHNIERRVTYIGMS